METVFEENSFSCRAFFFPKGVDVAVPGALSRPCAPLQCRSSFCRVPLLHCVCCELESIRLPYCKLHQAPTASACLGSRRRLS
eukprot:3337246-Amphidinium_carterae.1